MKKSQHKKIVKVKRVKKRLSPKSGSMPKKQRSLELKILANQVRSLPLIPRGPLPN